MKTTTNRPPKSHYKRNDPRYLQLHELWVCRVTSWLRTKPGRATHLAEYLGVDRRRISQWFARDMPDVPAWAVNPIANITGEHLAKLNATDLTIT